jgi:hypothetical protein
MSTRTIHKVLTPAKKTSRPPVFPIPLHSSLPGTRGRKRPRKDEIFIAPYDPDRSGLEQVGREVCRWRIAKQLDMLHARFPGFGDDLGFLAVALEYYADAAMAHSLYPDGAPCTPAERKRRMRLGVRGASLLECAPLVRE